MKKTYREVTAIYEFSLPDETDLKAWHKSLDPHEPVVLTQGTILHISHWQSAYCEYCGDYGVCDICNGESETEPGKEFL